MPDAANCIRISPYDLHNCNLSLGNRIRYWSRRPICTTNPFIVTASRQLFVTVVTFQASWRHNDCMARPGMLHRRHLETGDRTIALLQTAPESCDILFLRRPDSICGISSHLIRRVYPRYWRFLGELDVSSSVSLAVFCTGGFLTMDAQSPIDRSVRPSACSPGFSSQAHALSRISSNATESKVFSTNLR